MLKKRKEKTKGKPKRKRRENQKEKKSDNGSAQVICGRFARRIGFRFPWSSFFTTNLGAPWASSLRAQLPYQLHTFILTK